MNKYLTFEDGHIEYWSTYSVGRKLQIFNSQKSALDHIDTANDCFLRGIEFHKELNGIDLLSRD